MYIFRFFLASFYTKYDPTHFAVSMISMWKQIQTRVIDIRPGASRGILRGPPWHFSNTIPADNNLPNYHVIPGCRPSKPYTFFFF